MAPTPLRVVPLLTDLGTVAGHGLILLSAEVYDAFTDLRFARVDRGATQPLPRRVPPPEAWQVRDDAGTRYPVIDAVGRGDRGFGNGEARLQPTLRDSATGLEVAVVLVPGEPPLMATVDVTATSARMA